MSVAGPDAPLEVHGKNFSNLPVLDRALDELVHGIEAIVERDRDALTDRKSVV